MNAFWGICGALAVSFLCQSAWSQQDAPLEADHVAAERLRIETRRQQANAELDAQERVCQTQFVVTSCVHDVGVRRIAAMSELKRQEAVLNDAERRQRGAEQIKRVKEKVAERRLSDADLALSPPATQADRKMAQDAKILQHQKAAAPTGSANVGKSMATPVTPDLGTNRAAHFKRLEDARQRRADRDRRLLDRPAAGVAALPVPK